MCLIAFAINASARWPLVIAANRDEFLDRPTLPLARWQTAEGHDIISGRDLQAGGTWLGVTPAGRVAFLTNVREPAPVSAPLSRGSLVTDWLASSSTAARFVDDLQEGSGPAAGSYGGFNLVLGDFIRGEWWWVSNRNAASGVEFGASEARWQSRPLEPGIYGLSNAALDTAWPKTTRLKLVLAESMDQSPGVDELQASLWAALGDGTRASLGQLPSTGVPLVREQALSSAFVDMPDDGYGTRSSTVLTVTRPNHEADRTSLNVRLQEREHVRVPGVDGSHALSWQSRTETLHWSAPVSAA